MACPSSSPRSQRGKRISSISSLACVGMVLLNNKRISISEWRHNSLRPYPPSAMREKRMFRCCNVVPSWLSCRASRKYWSMRDAFSSGKACTSCFLVNCSISCLRDVSNLLMGYFIATLYYRNRTMMKALHKSMQHLHHVRVFIVTWYTLYIASLPVSPVRIRITSSTGNTNILPSPICPVRAFS